jgi:hypothetical protein
MTSPILDMQHGAQEAASRPQTQGRAGFDLFVPELLPTHGGDDLQVLQGYGQALWKT